MDFANRGNRPIQQQQTPAPQTSSEMPIMPQKADKKRLDFTKLSTIFVLFGVALLSAVLIVGLVFGGKTVISNKESSLINADKYQAVFLDSQDGQVYFGKLRVYNSDTYVLSEIYYVRVDNPVQPEGQNQSKQNISLAKLGSELHGPEDVMFIRRDNVLFWENLKEDGQVVCAIRDYQINTLNNKDVKKSDKCTAANQQTQQQDSPNQTQEAGSDAANQNGAGTGDTQTP
jgi:hypothetical protein